MVLTVDISPLYTLWSAFLGSTMRAANGYSLLPPYPLMESSVTNGLSLPLIVLSSCVSFQAYESFLPKGTTIIFRDSKWLSERNNIFSRKLNLALSRATRPLVDLGWRFILLCSTDETTYLNHATRLTQPR
jgi:hypothetical protein